MKTVYTFNVYMYGYIYFNQNVLITLAQQQNNNTGQSSKFQVYTDLHV